MINGRLTSQEPVADSPGNAQNFIKIKARELENILAFEYNFQSFRDLEIRFKVIMRTQFDMSMCDTRGYQFSQTSHEYQHNGLRPGNPVLVRELTKGFHRTQVEHYHTSAVEEDDMDTDMQTNINENIHIDMTATIAPRLAGSSARPERRKAGRAGGGLPAGRSKRKPAGNMPSLGAFSPMPIHPRSVPHVPMVETDSANSSGLGFFKESIGSLFGRGKQRRQDRHLTETNNDMKKLKISADSGNNCGRKYLIQIEFENHPAFTISIDESKTVLNLKGMMEKMLELCNFNRVKAADMRLLFATDLLDNKTKLRNLDLKFDGFNYLALVTTTPGLAPEHVDRTPIENATENQARAKNVLNSCRILLRNFQACNRNAEYGRNPTDRVRFNVVTTKTQDNVCSADIGDFITEVSVEVKRFAVELSKLSNKMIQDRALDRNSREYEQYKRDIQV